LVSLLCYLLPPIFFMFMREKVLGEKINCGYSGNLKSFVKEYLLSTCFLNFFVIMITVLVFKHGGSLDRSFFEYADFAFHYLLLSLVIAVIEPVIENWLRFHITYNISFAGLNKKSDLLICKFRKNGLSVPHKRNG